MTHRAGCLWMAATKATADIDAIRFNMIPPATPAMPFSILGRVHRLRQVRLVLRVVCGQESRCQGAAFIEPACNSRANRYKFTGKSMG